MAAKPSILVLGGTGMLGHRLANGLIDLGYDVRAAVRARPGAQAPYGDMPVFRNADQIITGIDAFDHKAIRETVSAAKADVVINCIGVIKQKGDGKAVVPCIAINALLPHVLDEAVATYGGMLIHFSTDCVFSGASGHYAEDDAADATDWYGRTKFMGEVGGADALTIRTSIIGPEIASFSSLVEWFVAHAHEPIKGFDRAIYSGLTTREMVHVVDHVLTHHRDLRGLYQVASQPISKFDLLIKLRDTLGLSTRIARETDFVIDRSMVATRFAQTTGYAAPSWDMMIEGLAADLRDYWSRGWSVAPPASAFIAHPSQQEPTH